MIRSGHIIVPALAYYAGVTFITASGMILYYCGKARIRGETFYIYRSSKPKKKAYKAKPVMPKTGKKINSKIKVSKGGKQRIRDTGLAGLSDAEVARRARSKAYKGEEKQRYIKEAKARDERDKKKRANKHKSSKKKSKKKGD